jgi:hypothetical protein
MGNQITEDYNIKELFYNIENYPEDKYKYILQGVNLNNIKCMYLAGEHNEEINNIKDAEHYYKMAIECGDIYSKYKYAKLLLKGEKDIKIILNYYFEAIKWDVNILKDQELLTNIIIYMSKEEIIKENNSNPIYEITNYIYYISDFNNLIFLLSTENLNHYLIRICKTILINKYIDDEAIFKISAIERIKDEYNDCYCTIDKIKNIDKIENKELLKFIKNNVICNDINFKFYKIINKLERYDDALNILLNGTDSNYIINNFGLVLDILNKVNNNIKLNQIINLFDKNISKLFITNSFYLSDNNIIIDDEEMLLWYYDEFDNLKCILNNTNKQDIIIENKNIFLILSIDKYNPELLSDNKIDKSELLLFMQKIISSCEKIKDIYTEFIKNQCSDYLEKKFSIKAEIIKYIYSQKCFLLIKKLIINTLLDKMFENIDSKINTDIIKKLSDYNYEKYKKYTENNYLFNNIL